MTHDFKICIYPRTLNINEGFLHEIDQGKLANYIIIYVCVNIFLYTHTKKTFSMLSGQIMNLGSIITYPIWVCIALVNSFCIICIVYFSFRCTLALLSGCRVPFSYLCLWLVLLWVCLWLAGQWSSHNSFCTWARIHLQQNKSGTWLQLTMRNLEHSSFLCPCEMFFYFTRLFPFH